MSAGFAATPEQIEAVRERFRSEGTCAEMVGSNICILPAGHEPGHEPAADHRDREPRDDAPHPNVVQGDIETVTAALAARGQSEWFVLAAFQRLVAELARRREENERKANALRAIIAIQDHRLHGYEGGMVLNAPEVDVAIAAKIARAALASNTEPRCQGCEDAPLGQHTGPHDWERPNTEPLP